MEGVEREARLARAQRERVGIAAENREYLAEEAEAQALSGAAKIQAAKRAKRRELSEKKKAQSLRMESVLRRREEVHTYTHTHTHSLSLSILPP